MSDVYVFLGPSLPALDAAAALDAEILPPVAAGDVGRLWRRRPRAIGIVDGYFEHAPAVWHKEILWIMERGVHVFGAAGMGALRAVELDSFGMHGVGRVYEDFRDGALDADDEVAVAHAGPEDGYRARSEAMVNIRATLRSACDLDVISPATEELLIAVGTGMFYQDRSWPALLDAALAASADPTEVKVFRDWLPAGRVDQQADDVLAMLSQIREFLAADPDPQTVAWTVANTTRWVAAKERANIAVSEDDAGLAAGPEDVLDEIRLRGPGVLESARGRALLDVLRTRGEYGRLAARAASKLTRERQCAAEDAEPGEAGSFGQLALEWFFSSRGGIPVPEDLLGYARSCGFANEKAFRAAVLREYRCAGSGW